MTPQEKLRERAKKTYENLFISSRANEDDQKEDIDFINQALIQTRNEALEELLAAYIPKNRPEFNVAQQISLNNLIDIVRSLKTGEGK